MLDNLDRELLLAACSPAPFVVLVRITDTSRSACRARLHNLLTRGLIQLEKGRYVVTTTGRALVAPSRWLRPISAANARDVLNRSHEAKPWWVPN
jgi:hypothetical protein